MVMKVYVQDCIASTPLRFSDGVQIVPFSVGRNATDDIAALERDAQSSRGPVLLFCSLQVVRLIRRSGRFPRLAAALLADFDKFAWSQYAAALPATHLLNEHHRILPYGHVAAAVDRWGVEGIFIRPDSGCKEFPGQVLRGNLSLELQIMAKTYHLDNDIPVVIAHPQVISHIEFRVWYSMGSIASYTSYGHDGLEIHEPPHSLLALAEEIGFNARIFDGNFVGDFAISEMGPKLVECNPISTSGIYEGARIEDIANAMRELCPI